jgi:hypothetical protein
LPVALRQKDGNSAANGKLVTPTVSGSDLPRLLGLSALKKNKPTLDFNTMELHFCGPGGYDLAKATPPGTDALQLEVAPSGHMVLLCCEFWNASGSHAAAEEYTLTLMSKTSQQKVSGNTPAPQQPPRFQAQLSDATVPPPPGCETH